MLTHQEDDDVFASRFVQQQSPAIPSTLEFHLSVRGRGMLHVTCGVNESFVIGQIVVTILEISGDHVHLSISNPQNDPPYWEQTVYCGEVESFELMAQ